MIDLSILRLRRLSNPLWEKGVGLEGDKTCGAFELMSREDTKVLRVIATAGEGWDHVSVSRADRTPTWAEMEQVKRQFFKDDETAMQLHLAVAEHINCHPFCLHIWRPWHDKIPLPPREFV